MLPVFLKYLNCNLYLLSIGTLLHFGFSIFTIILYCIFRVNCLYLVVRVNWPMETKQEPLHVLKNRYTCIYPKFHILKMRGGYDKKLEFSNQSPPTRNASIRHSFKKYSIRESQEYCRYALSSRVEAEVHASLHCSYQQDSRSKLYQPCRKYHRY